MSPLDKSSRPCQAKYFVKYGPVKTNRHWRGKADMQRDTQAGKSLALFLNKDPRDTGTECWQAQERETFIWSLCGWQVVCDRCCSNIRIVRSSRIVLHAPSAGSEQPVTVKCIRFLTLSARQQLERMPRRQAEANKAQTGNANPAITNTESGLASSQTSSSSESQFLLAKWVLFCFVSPALCGFCFASNYQRRKNFFVGHESWSYL